MTTTFAYRGDGLRNSRTVGGGATTTFTWDIAAALPVILDDGNQYLYGAGLTAMKQSGSWYYYLADGLGSTMDIVNASGVSQKSYTYDVYGEATPSGGLSNEFDFAGQQTDATGLQYLRARYYDSDTGVFVGRDPLAAIPQWHTSPIEYANGNPTTFVDPSGLLGKPSWDDLKSAGKKAAKVVAPAIGQCVAWGAAGAIGGPQSAAAGCLTGAGANLWSRYVSDDLLSQCVIWGVGGWKATGSKVAGAGGCVGGILSWANQHGYGPGDSRSECGIWAAAGFFFAPKGASWSTALKAAVAGCGGGAAGEAVDDAFGDLLTPDRTLSEKFE